MMDWDRVTESLWKGLAEQALRLGKAFELPVRFSSDGDGRALAVVVMTPDGPRVRLSEGAREAFRGLDKTAAAERIANPRHSEAWLAEAREVEAGRDMFTLNEVCRIVYGPLFRDERSTHAYNAYYELRFEPQAISELLPGLFGDRTGWIPLQALRDRWFGMHPELGDDMDDGTTRSVPAFMAADEPAQEPRIQSARKRQALETLKADRLRELARDLEVEAESYRDRDPLVTALCDPTKVRFDVVLGLLSRDELKDICSALRLPTLGREKTPIIARILQDDPPPGGARSAEPRTPGVDGAQAEGEGIRRSEKEQALETLKAERLRELVRELGVMAASLRVREDLIEALSDERQIAFGQVLGELSREELKDICEELGLDSSGREKSVIAHRILTMGTGLADSGPEDDQDDEDNDDEDVEAARREPAHHALMRLVGPSLEVMEPGKGWPSVGTLETPSGVVPVEIYVRAVGRSGRGRPNERRFQNPAEKAGRAIRAPEKGYALLLGVWTEQGDERAVLVALDAYRRLEQSSRVSLFMPLALLEEAADTGYAEHRSHSGEALFAFRPENLGAHLERMSVEAGLKAAPAGPRPSVVRSLSVASAPASTASLGDDGRVPIRPKVGMYSAFARLNYKPWYALAEFVDNAVQSYLASGLEAQGGPLLIDVRLEEDEIVVTDRAAGISPQDFPRAFSPSTPPPDASGLSEFGLGMKAAACWFAREWSVRTSAINDPVERTIEFNIPQITKEGIESLPILERPAPAEQHYTVITMRNLRQRPRGNTLKKVKNHLASMYRVLMREGAVRVRLSTVNATEDLTFAQPKLLVAPYFKDPEGAPQEWRREFDIRLDDQRRVWGWAGLLETGSTGEAGFAVFRRRRLIQGSGDDAYRPTELFKKPNSFTYQRLVGELHVEGFNVSHTKDGIQWDGLEEAIISRIKAELTDWRLPVLQQAEGHRSRRRAQDLAANFGLEAVASAGAVLASDATADVIASQLVPLPEAEPSRPEAPLRSVESVITKRTFTFNVLHDQHPWAVSLELVRDPATEWFERGSETNLEERKIQVQVNLAHPFSEQFINEDEATLQPLMRVVCGLAIAEETARASGVKQAGEIRRRLNQLLRKGLGAVGRVGGD